MVTCDDNVVFLFKMLKMLKLMVGGCQSDTDCYIVSKLEIVLLMTLSFIDRLCPDQVIIA